MNKIMVLSCCTISLLGILGLNVIDSVYAQHAPPIKQIQTGVLPLDVQCNANLQLIFSPSSKNPACVRQSTMQALVQRGWLTVDNLMMVKNTQTPEAKTIEVSVKEVDEVYKWSDSDGTNPTINLVVNTDNVLQITNPTDVKHEFVIESNGEELAASGDIAPDGSGKMSFTPTTSGVFGYHCEYHPDTMKGTINVS
ncbi:MAG: cupredoxin domain-containing protein [Thaumarchaeota archaeon]|nr:cupredoxin domain-containing protein [Nitrososphaerota archaeon]